MRIKEAEEKLKALTGETLMIFYPLSEASWDWDNHHTAILIEIVRPMFLFFC